MTNNTLMAWHYSRGHNYAAIIKSGFLACATAGISEGEKPVVWFSINQLWEATVNGMTIEADRITYTKLTMLETKATNGGLYRFGVPSGQLIPWINLVKVANISSKTKKVLEASARKSGSNPFQWCGSLQRIDIRETIIETMNDANKWQSVEKDVHIKQDA